MSPLVSTVVLRRIVGGLGLALPFVCVIWGYVATGEVLGSISAYVDTPASIMFHGTLWAVAACLCAYVGYDIRDNVAGWIAGIAAVIVSLFAYNGSFGWLHLGAAAVFFLTLAYFSAFLFTETLDVPTPRKEVRNRVYYVSSWVIIATLVALGTHGLFGPPYLEHFVLVGETVMLLAFGTAWLIKGETLWRDA
jgi:hypothetical protein